MNLNTILEMTESMLESSSEDILSNANNLRNDVGEYMSEMANNGMNIVLGKMDEQKLSKTLGVMRAMLISSMFVEGVASNLLLSELKGELKPFSDTLVLTLIGILADEEVI